MEYLDSIKPFAIRRIRGSAWPSLSRAHRGVKPRAATVRTMAWNKGSNRSSNGQLMKMDFSYGGGTTLFQTPQTRTFHVIFLEIP